MSLVPVGGAAGSEDGPLGVARGAGVVGDEVVGAGGADDKSVEVAVVLAADAGAEDVGVARGDDRNGALLPGVLDALGEAGPEGGRPDEQEITEAQVHHPGAVVDDPADAGVGVVDGDAAARVGHLGHHQLTAASRRTGRGQAATQGRRRRRATPRPRRTEVEQINLIQAKGGQGASVTACAVALKAAEEGRRVRLDGHDRAMLAAILGTHGDGPVTLDLIVGGPNGERFDLVIHDGGGEEGTSLLVTRPCYLALRQALNLGVTADAAGVVMVAEPGRALDGHDVAAVIGLPVIATIPLRAEIARAVDAGVLPARPPDPLATAASQILAFALTNTGREVA